MLGVVGLAADALCCLTQSSKHCEVSKEQVTTLIYLPLAVREQRILKIKDINKLIFSRKS